MQILTPFFLGIILSVYPAGFQEGDWVTYTNFRFVTSATLDQTTIYFGTTNGVTRYDRFINSWLEPLTVADGIPHPYIENIAYDPNQDRIHVLTGLGPAYYQKTFRQWYPATGFPYDLARNDLNPSALGMLTTEFGYVYQNGRLTDMNFRSYQLTRGVNDGFDHFFVGAWGLSAAVINTRYGDLKLLPFGLYTEDASALIRVGDKFWIGAGFDDSGEPGITLCDTSLQTWKYFVPRYMTGLASTRISSALKDGNLTWLGTDYGLVRFESDGESFETFADFSPLPSEIVTSLAADSSWIYIGTARGLGYVARGGRPEKRKKEKKSADNSIRVEEAGAPLSGKNRLDGWYVNCIELIGDYMYVGTDRGVLRRLVNTYGDFEYVNTPQKMLSDDILDIAKGGDSLFFATRNDIIVINSSTADVSILTEPGKFGNWRIRQIAIENGNLWAATNVGLWKCRLADGYSRLYTTADGMISSDVRTLELIGDYVWTATPKGVIRFLWNRPVRVD
jgi:hypothetical protein